MKAVILSGGKGTRLGTVSGGLPKPLMPILGTPLLCHTAALLQKAGFSEMIVTLCHKGDTLRRCMESCASRRPLLRYVEEDPEAPLGTAGTVKLCRPFLDSEPFLVMSGDCLCDFDAARLMRRHRSGVTLALTRRAIPQAYGMVLTDADGQVTGFVEKPTREQMVTDQISTGIYVLDPDIPDHIPSGQPFDFARDLFPALLRKGIPLRGVPMEGYWQDIGTPRDYYQANLDVINGLCRLPEP